MVTNLTQFLLHHYWSCSRYSIPLLYGNLLFMRFGWTIPIVPTYDNTPSNLHSPQHQYQDLNRNTTGAVQYALCLSCIICMISSRPRLELQPHSSQKSMAGQRHWQRISCSQQCKRQSHGALATRIAGQMFNCKYSSHLLHQYCAHYLLYLSCRHCCHALVFIFVLLLDTTFYTVARSLSIQHIYHDASGHSSR